MYDSQTQTKIQVYIEYVLTVIGFFAKRREDEAAGGIKHMRIAN
jgi:hypothetical protein